MDFESSSVDAAGATSARRDGDLECDRCGRSVPREVVPRQLRHRDGDGEIVVLCAECEGGAD
jgi:hypothetical protein